MSSGYGNPPADLHLKSATSGDIDGDGDIDLWVDSIGGANVSSHFLVNNGDGTFTVDEARAPAALRHNPLESWWECSWGRSTSPRGTMCWWWPYAAAAGTPAADGRGRNSPYTAALVALIGVPRRGEPARGALCATAHAVTGALTTRRRPWRDALSRSTAGSRGGVRAGRR